MTNAEITSDCIVKSTLPTFEYPNISFAEYASNGLGKQNPSSLALIDPNNNGQLTFGELHQQVQTLAKGFLHLGITQRDLVLLFADNSLQLVVSLFASIYLGVPFSPVKPANGSFELTQQIVDSKGSFLVVGQNQLSVLMQALNDSDYTEAIDLIKTIIVLDSESLNSDLLNHSLVKDKQIVTFTQALDLGNGKLLDKIPHFPVSHPCTDRLLIAYTSGTTGKPKGAIHSHRSFMASLINTRPAEDVTGKCALVWNPIGHISGVIFVPVSLIHGLSVVLFSNTDLEAMLDSVERFKVNILFISANHVTALVNNHYTSKYNLSSLQVFKYGGSKIAANLLNAIKEKYRVGLYDYYGSTEFYGHVENRDPEDLFKNFEPGNLGTVLPNVEMKIIDLKSGEALAPYEHGEICFRGAPCFIGYLNNDKATRETIDDDGWFHSGDVGYYTDKGCLFISDRIKEMLKYKSWSVIPAEIEDFLYRHSAVESVCVVGVPHSTDGCMIRAYVQLVEGKSVTEQELTDCVKEHMGFQKRLRGGVRFVIKVPRTVIGKVDRQFFKSLVNNELITEEVP